MEFTLRVEYKALEMEKVIWHGSAWICFHEKQQMRR